MDSKGLTKQVYTIQIRTEQEALLSQKAIDCERLYLEAALQASAMMAFDLMGWQANQQNVDNIVKFLTDDVLRFVPFIRVDEIPIAIKKGCYGEFGEFIGINVATIIRFLKSYYNSSRRAEIAKLNKEEEQEVIPTSEQLHDQENDIVKKAFESFKEKGSFNDFGNHIYNILDRRQIITFSPERKKEFMIEAKKVLLTRNNPETALNQKEKRDFKSITNAVLSASTKDSDGHMIIVREAKRIALNTFFSELVEMDSDINDFLDGQPF